MATRCVIVGCGWAGMHHLKTVVSSSYSRLSAVVEPDEKKRETLTREYDVPVYENLDALFSSDIEFDTGIVATLPPLHSVLCASLIAEKKNVLCEKPICRKSSEIEKLQAMAQVAGVRFGVVFNQRYGTAVRKAKELIDAEGGRLHLITASMYQHLPTQIGGNIDDTFMITDSCCHLLDLMTYFCGPVRTVKAVASKNESELYSDLAAALVFENSCIGSLCHTSVGGKLDTQHPFQCLDIHTSNARFLIENQFDRLTVYPHDKEARQIHETSVFQRRDYALSMRLACEDYLRAVVENRLLPIDIGEALTNMRVLEDILSSIRM